MSLTPCRAHFFYSTAKKFSLHDFFQVRIQLIFSFPFIKKISF